MTASRKALAQATFVDKIDVMTRAAIFDGATSWETLLRRLPAIYPTEVLASLGRLASRGAIPAAAAYDARQQASRNGATAVEGRSLLPLPHPLDFEWRFTPDAARGLLDRAGALTPAGGDLLLFGTPGLAVEALTLPIGRRLAFLAESNSVTDRVVALNHATGSPLAIAFCSGGLPRESADAVILDPPWYLDFVRPMLAAAAHACRPGGVVLISLAPIGTRPSAEADYRAAAAFAVRLGLDVVEHCELAVAYETPFFERNALAAAGLFPPPHWRRGDLVIFRKTRPPSRPFVVGRGAYRRGWTQVDIGRMRLFVRVSDEARSEETSLVSLIEGDILPTVSRRDLRRGMAQVWTSGNRIFRTDNPQLLFEAAISCNGEDLGASVQHYLWGSIRGRDAQERVVDELRALAAVEAREEQVEANATLERSMPWRSSSTNCWSMSTATISG
jgi:hypothetical protein